MAGVDVGKLLNSKIETKNAILRYKSKSFQVLNRQKLSEEFIARVKRERDHLLDQRRDLDQCDIRKIAADVIQDEWSSQQFQKTHDGIFKSQNPPDGFNLERELLLEEELEKDALRDYEDWFNQEIENLVSSENSEDTDYLLVCPVCCRQCFQFTTTTICCQHCNVSYPLTKSIEELRSDINSNLAEHNSNCYNHPQFSTLPDSGGRNSLLILCHACSYLNVLL